MSRILIHSPVFSPDAVSTSYLMTDLAIGLKNAGHEVTVLTATPHYTLDARAAATQPMVSRLGGIFKHSNLQGIPVWHVRIPWKGQRRPWVRAIDYLYFNIVALMAGCVLVGRQDLILATSPPITMGVNAWLLGRRWGAPSIYKVAEIYPDVIISQELIKSRALIALMRWMERLVYRKITRLVPIAHQFAETILSRGVAPEKLCFIPDFVETDFYQPCPRDNAFAREHGLMDGFVVLYAGNIGMVQDWESVLGAAEQARGTPVRFVIVGDGNQRSWLAQQCEHRRLANVKLIGYQPKEIMPLINASCDVCMIPMTSHGSLGGVPSKVYSIMACGKPVIVTAALESELTWIINTARCGRVVEAGMTNAFATAVLRASRESELLKEEGNRGREFAIKHYSRQAVISRYDELVRQLTSSKHRL